MIKQNKHRISQDAEEQERNILNSIKYKLTYNKATIAKVNKAKKLAVVHMNEYNSTISLMETTFLKCC